MKKFLHQWHKQDIDNIQIDGSYNISIKPQIMLKLFGKAHFSYNWIKNYKQWTI